MKLEFQYQGPREEPISLDAFEAAIKKKRDNKNELDQIAEFNRKTGSDHQAKGSEFDVSEFNLSAWNGELKESGKVNFFQEEGKQLLGGSKTIKNLDWKLVTIDLFLHVVTLILTFLDSSIVLLTLRDAPLILGSLLVLYDYHFKISAKYQQLILKAYRYVLLASAAISIYIIVTIILTADSDDESRKIHYVVLIAGIVALFCEYKLWKASRYLLFFLGELEKKQSPEDIDFSDQI